jgi:hypothetical protein
LAFPSALLYVVAVLLLTVLGGAGVPGYSHASQFISELGATGAPHEMLVRFAGFLPAGVFLCLFTLGAFRALPRSRLTSVGLIGVLIYAVGYIVAAIFPCDPGCRPAEPSASQIVHNLFGLAGYALAPPFLVALGWSARRWPGGSYLTVPALLAAGITFVGLLTLSPESPYAGVSQRGIEATVLLWVMMCAWYARSRSAA